MRRLLRPLPLPYKTEGRSQRAPIIPADQFGIPRATVDTVRVLISKCGAEFQANRTERAIELAKDALAAWSLLNNKGAVGL
jgi:hypothetical protein